MMVLVNMSIILDILQHVGIFPNSVSKTWGSVFIIKYEDSDPVDCIQTATTVLESRWMQAMIRSSSPTAAIEAEQCSRAACLWLQYVTPIHSVHQNVWYTPTLMKKYLPNCPSHTATSNTNVIKLPASQYMHSLHPDSCSHQADFCLLIVTHILFCDKNLSITWANNLLR
jgi:hypothetical protein